MFRLYPVWLHHKPEEIFNGNEQSSEHMLCFDNEYSMLALNYLPGMFFVDHKPQHAQISNFPYLS